MSSPAKDTFPSVRRLVMAAVCLGVLYYVVIPERSCFYRSAFDKSTNTTRQGNYVELRGAKFWFASAPDFLIRDRKVYLLSRQTFTFPLFLAVSKRDRNWTVGQLLALSSTHSELKEMWPDPTANNLGIDWIEVAPARQPAN